MTFREPLKILGEIIAAEMGLPSERVMVYNQKWNLPGDQDIFVSLQSGSRKIIRNSVTYEDREGVGFFEVALLNMVESVVIDIFSGDSSARERKEEIPMALVSTLSQQEQEKYSIKIAEIPSAFLDVSNVESARRLNRYNITVPVFSWRTKEKVVEYYDSQETEVIVNK